MCNRLNNLNNMADQFSQMSPIGGMMQPKPPIVLHALYGGVFIGMLFGVPYLNFVNCCCCAGVLAGGVLTVFFYKKDFTPDMPPLDSGDALKLGALAGAIGGVIATIVGQIFQFVSGQNVKEELEAAMEQMPGGEGEAVMQMLMGFIDSPFYILMSLIFSVVLCTIFGVLGSLIGYSIFKPKQPSIQSPLYPPTQMP
jgi:hypothetical protein